MSLNIGLVMDLTGLFVCAASAIYLFGRIEGRLNTIEYLVRELIKSHMEGQ